MTTAIKLTNKFVARLDAAKAAWVLSLQLSCDTEDCAPIEGDYDAIQPNCKVHWPAVEALFDVHFEEGSDICIAGVRADDHEEFCPNSGEFAEALKLFRAVG